MKHSIYTGNGIISAILDTGIFPHADFDKRILFFHDYVGRKKYAYDDNGHGTHVAGILCGSGKLSNGRHKGIAPKSQIVSLKILDKRGNGKMEHILSALRWIGTQKGKLPIRIVNISIGTADNTNRKNKELLRAVEQLWDDGFIVVTAAGNMGPQAGTITVPGCSRKVITVGASDLLDGKDGKGGISSVGPTQECICKPDLVAPGSNIIACSSLPNKAYQVKSGTSMAVPIVSGAIALLLEKDPLLTNVEVKMLLREACVDLGYDRNQQGWGKIDIEKLMNL